MNRASPTGAWETTRIKYVSSLKGRLGWQGLTAEEYRSEGPHVVSSAHFRDDRIVWEMCPRVSVERYRIDANIQLQQGDVLLMKDGAALGKLAFLDDLPGPACLNSHLLLFRPKRAAYSPKFLYYYICTNLFQEYILVRGTGATFLGVSQETIGNYSLALPSKSYQRAIVAFLDRKTAAIDALIAKKERLIELLQEKRQTLITQAVTKGLDPTVPMKDSGISVLGPVPSHWGIKRLMHLTPSRRQIMYGIVLPGPNVEEGIPIVKSGDCVPDKLRLARLHRTTPEIEAPYARARLEPDDIVYAIRGSIGMAAIVPLELRGANLTQDAARIAPRVGINSKWMLYAVQSGGVWAQLQAGVVGATVKGINIRDLKRPFVPVPPRHEQDAIVAHLDNSLAAMERALRGAERGVALLREYRQALITAAVTGKLDVERAGAQPEDRVEQEAMGA